MTLTPNPSPCAKGEGLLAAQARSIRQPGAVLPPPCRGTAPLALCCGEQPVSVLASGSGARPPRATGFQWVRWSREDRYLSRFRSLTACSAAGSSTTCCSSLRRSCWAQAAASSATAPCPPAWRSPVARPPPAAWRSRPTWSRAARGTGPTARARPRASFRPRQRTEPVTYWQISTQISTRHTSLSGWGHGPPLQSATPPNMTQ